MKKILTSLLLLTLLVWSSNLFAAAQIINGIKVIEGKGDKYSPAGKMPMCSSAGYEKKSPETCTETNGQKTCAKSTCVDPSPIKPATINSGFYRSGTPGCSSSNCNETRCYNPGGSIKCFKPGARHGGLDYRAPRGTPIFSAVDGIYTLVGGSSGIVRVSSAEQGVAAEYLHLYCGISELKSGQAISKGDIVGFTGNTGESQGPHLHLQFKKLAADGKTVIAGTINPMDTKSNSMFCPTAEDTCVTATNINLGSDAKVRVCGSSDFVTPGGPSGTGSSAGGGASAESIGVLADHQCHPSQFTSTFQTCLFCDLFKTVFNTASRIARLSYDALAPSISKVLVVAFAIWIAFQILPAISSLKGAAAPDFLKIILEKTIIIFVAFFFLTTSLLGEGSFFAYIMEPIFNTGFKLAQLVMGRGETCTVALEETHKIIGAAEGGGLPASMGNSVVCTINLLQNKIQEIFAFGSTSICVAMHIKSVDKIPILFDISYMLSGIVLWCFGLMLMIIFPFLLLDSVMQLCVAAALLPVAIAAFCFDSTKKYSKITWDTFMAVVMNFVFLCLAISILILAIDETINPIRLSSGNDAASNAQQIAETMSAAQVEDMVDALGWSGKVFLKICFVMLLAWSTLESISEFAGQFSGNPTKSNIGRNIGGVMVSGAKNMGSRIGGTVLKPVGKGIKSAAGQATTGFKRFRTQQQAKAIKSEYADFQAGKIKNKNISFSKDENGNIVKTQKLGNTGSVTTTVGTDAKGTATLSKDVNKISAADRKADRRLATAKDKGVAIQNANGSTTYEYKKRGRTLAVTENKDGQFSYVYRKNNGAETKPIIREVRGSGGTKTQVSKDRKVTQYYNGKGQLVGEKVEAIGANVQKVLGEKGTLRPQAVAQMMEQKNVLKARYDAEQDPSKKADLFKAVQHEEEQSSILLANAILSERMPHHFNKQIMNTSKYDNTRTFKERKTEIRTDEKGCKVIQITEIKADGSKEVYGVVIHKDGKVMSSHEATDKTGYSVKHETDGVLQKKTMGNENDKGKKTVFAFANKSRLNEASTLKNRKKVAQEDLFSSLFGEEEKEAATEQMLKATKDEKTLLNMKAFS